MNTQPLAEYVHHLTDCPTREIGRGDEGCTCGAPKIIADIELAYGLLWCILGTDERAHRARMLLAKAIGPDGMKRGLTIRSDMGSPERQADDRTIRTRRRSMSKTQNEHDLQKAQSNG